MSKRKKATENDAFTQMLAAMISGRPKLQDRPVDGLDLVIMKLGLAGPCTFKRMRTLGFLPGPIRRW